MSPKLKEISLKNLSEGKCYQKCVQISAHGNIDEAEIKWLAVVNTLMLLRPIHKKHNTEKVYTGKEFRRNEFTVGAGKRWAGGPCQ